MEKFYVCAVSHKIGSKYYIKYFFPTYKETKDAIDVVKRQAEKLGLNFLQTSCVGPFNYDDYEEEFFVSFKTLIGFDGYVLGERGYKYDKYLGHDNQTSKAVYEWEEMIRNYYM